MRKLDIVAPAFNEEEVVGFFHERLATVVDQLQASGWDVRIVYVDDSSTDDTATRLKEVVRGSSLNVDVLTTSRNSGHQAAIWLGVLESRRDSCVLAIDADLQDPPEVILELVKQIENHDLVLTRRVSRNDGFWKQFNARLFYGLVKHFSDGLLRPQVGDFWLLGEAAADRLRTNYQERHIFLRGIIQDLGLNGVVVDYHRDSRVAGKTHYTLAKMTHLAVAGVAGFTIRPLIYVSYIAALSVVFAAVTILFFVLGHYAGFVAFAPGVGLGIVVLLLLAVSTQLSIAVLAIYIAKISIETTRRPAVASALPRAERSAPDAS